MPPQTVKVEESPFRSYLKQLHYHDYIGDDNDWEDEFERWVDELYPAEVIAYADKWQKGWTQWTAYKTTP